MSSNIKDAPVIHVPKPSGKISLAAFADALRNTFANERQGTPWRAVAKRALQLAPIVLPEEEEKKECQQ
jgi:hypothetical protein